MIVYEVYAIELLVVEIEVPDGYSIPHEEFDTWTVGVYLSKEKAEAEAERLNEKTAKNANIKYYIHEWDVIE